MRPSGLVARINGSSSNTGRAGERILVIRDDGFVFTHPITDTVGPPTDVSPLPGANPPPRVAARPMDKWVLAHRDRVLVITEDGHVFAHRLTAHVEPAFELGGPNGRPAPSVAANPMDKWVLVVGDRILVITEDGKVYAHEITETEMTVHPAVELVMPPGGVAGTPGDRWVLAMGDKIVVVRGNGQVVTHLVRSDRIDGHLSVPSTQRVAANPQDRWLLGSGTVESNGKLLVIPYSPSGWRYFAGQQPDGLPIWQTNEPAARPVVPFGMFDSDPTNIRYDFHKCLGYFSVRYVQRVKKWVMLYTCGDRIALFGDISVPGRDRMGNVLLSSKRGVYMRSAILPWGPWSAPERIFDPSVPFGYCSFMHWPPGCASGTNPFEEEKRSPKSPDREIAGEYAPFLLPSQYAKPAPNGQTSIYYLMSTWNPYQVILMRSDVDLGVAP